MKLNALFLMLSATLILQHPIANAVENLKDEPMTEQQFKDAEYNSFDLTEYFNSCLAPTFGFRERKNFA